MSTNIVPPVSRWWPTFRFLLGTYLSCAFARSPTAKMHSLFAGSRLDCSKRTRIGVLDSSRSYNFPFFAKHIEPHNLMARTAIPMLVFFSADVRRRLLKCASVRRRYERELCGCNFSTFFFTFQMLKMRMRRGNIVSFSLFFFFSLLNF